MRQKKSFFFLLILTLFFCFSMYSYGWQGRMAGMEDPHGLVADESDYLIHVAKIAEGKGINFYGGYRFTYTEVEKFQTEIAAIKVDFPGETYSQNALLGSSFALGSGRMGLFFAYDGFRGDLDTGADDGFKNKDEFDNFSLRLMYGLPVGSFNFGAEAGVAYRKEKNSLLIYEDEFGLYNFHVTDEGWNINYNIPPFIPYDSKYWEIPLKAGFSSKFGPLDTQFTLRGSIIVSGDNELSMGYYDTSDSGYDKLKGDTKGWSMGADLWMRYHLGNSLSLPFMVRADYHKKTRDGRGEVFVFFEDVDFVDYENEETDLNLTLGGGVDKAFGQNTRLAAGIYYSYLNNKKDLSLKGFEDEAYVGEIFFDDFPSSVEHRATLRLAGEHAISPVFVLRAGMGLFYGWVIQDLVLGIGADRVKFEEDGYHWGAGASLGASIKFTIVTLEPFLSAGYQYLNLTDDLYFSGVLIPDVSRKDKREQWYVGGGLAVRFGQ